MSPGANRDRNARGLTAPTRAGHGKTARSGLSFLPDEAQEVLAEVLGEQGLAGIAVLCSLCRLTSGEIARCHLDGTRLVLDNKKGEPIARWPLPELLVDSVRETLETLGSPSPRSVSDLLGDTISAKVRERLEARGHLWARHVQVGMTILHHLGDAVAAEVLRDRPDRLRAWRRSIWVTADDVLPATTMTVAADYDACEATFWDLVNAKLTAADSAALAALTWKEK